MTKIRIEMDIEVRNMTVDELAFCGFDADDHEEYADEVDNLDAREVGLCIASLFGFNSDTSDEALAGSNIFVKLGHATLIRAELSA